MKVLLQRVSKASVSVNNQIVGEIKHGLLVFIAVEKNDTPKKAKRLAERVAHYRIFADDDDKTNLNVQQVQGEILVVSQFTLAADTTRGLRPGFSNAASGELSESLYLQFCEVLRSYGFSIPTGVFGADMQVALVNDGPMTFSLAI